MNVSWKKYIEKRSIGSHRPLLEEAVKYVTHKGVALDLGAGSMNDSKYLLANGFEHVIAMDNDVTAITFAHQIDSTRFEFVKESFEHFEYQNDFYDFINAQYALPFITEEMFLPILNKVIDSLRCDGIFCGQLFGERDSWNTTNSDKNFHSAEDIKILFKDMHIHKLQEEDTQGVTMLGKQKQWHVFHFIVSKR